MNRLRRSWMYSLIGTQVMAIPFHTSCVLSRWKSAKLLALLIMIQMTVKHVLRKENFIDDDISTLGQNDHNRREAKLLCTTSVESCLMPFLWHDYTPNCFIFIPDLLSSASNKKKTETTPFPCLKMIAPGRC